MLAEGKITLAEAEQLIDALEPAQPETPSIAVSGPKPRPKYVRMVASWAGTSDDDGPGRINIRVPLQLLRAGVQLTSLIPPQALAKANAELSKRDVPIDLTELKPQHLEELIEQLDELTIDLDDPDSKMQIFCE